LLILVAVVVHAPVATDLFGVEKTDWLRRANEAYLLAFAIPFFFDFVVSRRSQPGLELRRGSAFWKSRLLWYGGLVLGLALLEGPMAEAILGFRFPQILITIRDAWLGIVILTAYLDWSRGYWRSDHGPGQPNLKPGWVRAMYYAGLASANVLVFQGPVKEFLGPDLFANIDFHAEAFSSALLLPFYFDVIIRRTGGDPVKGVPAEPRVRSWILWLWLAANAVGVWLAQGTIEDLIPGGLGTWWRRSSEAPLAAIAVTIYIEWIRRRDGVKVKPASGPSRLAVGEVR
jgi:hypothetical protein